MEARYYFRRTCGKSLLGTKVLGNTVPERTTNFGWPAVQQVRDLCVYFLSSSFHLLPIFSSFSNNALNMTYRIVCQSVSQSVSVSVSESVSLERFENIRSNVKTSLGVRHSFICNDLL